MKILRIKPARLPFIFATFVAGFCAGCFSRSHHQRGASLLDDKVTTARVHSALAANPRRNLKEVKIATTNGVVTLSGFVASEQQKQEAAELARKVHRTRDVHNEIAVKSQYKEE